MFRIESKLILHKVGVNEDGSHFAIGELLDEIFDFEGSGEEDNDDQDSEKPVNVTYVVYFLPILSSLNVSYN